MVRGINKNLHLIILEGVLINGNGANGLHFFLKLGFTPCKAEQPLRGMVLQEKEAQKDYSIQAICLERTYS